ncbi:hypothetical protein ACOI1H_19760 [Loktanella sp. DJP18]|uniref:hypothetical protein n=1 Tax=Loktanella sp. DJP18 TaxID=3409788 RepID=UPI003BB80531
MDKPFAADVSRTKGVYVCIGDLSLGNLPLGTIRISAISASDAADRVKVAAAAAGLTGLFDFSSVPDPRLERQFAEAVACLAADFNINLPEACFHTESEYDGRKVRFPIPPGLVQISATKPMIIVSLAYQIDRDAKRTADNPLRTRISAESITFHLVEVAD